MRVLIVCSVFVCVCVCVFFVFFIFMYSLLLEGVMTLAELEGVAALGNLVGKEDLRITQEDLVAREARRYNSLRKYSSGRY